MHLPEGRVVTDTWLEERKRVLAARQHPDAWSDVGARTPGERMPAWNGVPVAGDPIDTFMDLVSNRLDPEIAARAACLGLDADMFHPERGDIGSYGARAVATCHTCPVIDECREWALDQPQGGLGAVKGVWGGLSEAQRIRVRNERKIAAEPSHSLPRATAHGGLPGDRAPHGDGPPAAA